MKKLTAIVLSLAMMISLLAACGSSSSTSTDSSTSTATDSSTSSSASTATDASTSSSDATEAVDPTAEPDGIVAGTVANFYSSMDCATLLRPGEEPTGHWLYQTIYETLFYAPNGNYEDGLEGLLAESWTLSDDGCVWVVNLHEDVYFTNGTNLTADLAVRAFEILRATGQEAIFAPMESYGATGEYQLTFTYANPNPEFMHQFAVANLAIFDPTLVEVEDTAESYIGASSGPYYISEYVSGDHITMTANENYWNEERFPHIETLYCKVILDTNTQVTALQSGEMTLGAVASYDSYETILATTDLITEQYYGCNRTLYLSSDYQCEYLDNVRVREAISMMVDMEQIALATTGGYGSVNYNAFGETVDYVHNRVYDPDAGLAILAEEGVDPSDIVLMPITDSTQSPIYENLQAQLSAYGITVDFAVQDAPAVMSAGWAGEWDIWAEHGGLNRYSFASCITMMFGETGMHNLCRNDEVDPILWDLVVKAFSTADYSVELEYMADIAQVLDENYLYIGNIQVPSWNVWSSDLQNVVIDESNGTWLACYSWMA